MSVEQTIEHEQKKNKKKWQQDAKILTPVCFTL